MSNAGFFGPDSVAWRVHRDPSNMVGGIRSLVVQALQPRAMAAVAQHGAFDDDFWGRLTRTSDYLLTLIFGTVEDAERASAVVRAVHACVKGVDPFTGQSYAADEPDLLVWVHNATVESHLAAYRQYGRRPLHSADADRYIAEMRVMGQLMGLPDGEVAQNQSDLDEYFRGVRDQLAVSPDARAGVRRLLFPKLPLALRPVWGVPTSAAVASLPDAYRKLYGLPWLGPLQPGIHLTTATFLNGIRLLLPPHPLVEAADRRVGVA